MNNDDYPNQQDSRQIRNNPSKDGNFNNDILKLSKTLDSIAKVILAERKQTETISKDLENEYSNKLKNLNTLINLILKLNDTDDSKVSPIVDTTRLDVLLKDKIDIIEKDGQSYALIPIKNEVSSDDNYNDIITDTSEKKKKKKKKKNKILCSFCNQPGHTRAHCDKRLYNVR